MPSGLDALCNNASSQRQTAVVTGGARRIGKGIVERLHADGFNVCLHCHNSLSDANAIASKLNAVRAGSVAVVALSLSTEDAEPLPVRCRRLIDSCYQTFGRCDVLVNNASGYYPTPLLGPSASSDDDHASAVLEGEVSDLFGSNAIAPFYLIRAFARRGPSLAAGAAPTSATRCVVNMVDSMTSQPLEGFTMYTMAKHALEGLTKSAALELAPANIRVNGVGPGLCVMPPVMDAAEQALYRGKVPLGRREASVEEIASAVSFLVSPESQYVTGTIINVDGGWSLTRA